MLQVSPQRDQREEPLQAKRVEGAKTAAVQDDFDRTEEPDLEPRRRFATDPAPVTRHRLPMVAVQPSSSLLSRWPVSMTSGPPCSSTSGTGRGGQHPLRAGLL